tara:strand:- start:259 stop:738 length:480 start_codon:yes stop_codon:yes gene_type:complete
MPIGIKRTKIDISEQKDIKIISQKISNYLDNGDVLFLFGEIGVGKTTFVRYLINHLQVKFNEPKTEVPSPTFNIINEYLIKKKRIAHIDLYRIKNENEIYNIGLFDNKDNCISFVEWPEIIKKKPDNRIELYFEYKENFNKRSLEISTKYKKEIINEFI